MGADLETTVAVSPTRSAKKGLGLTAQIGIGLVLGIALGAWVSEYNPAWAEVFKPFSAILLRLIKMSIAPIIFTSLVAGVAGAGHAKAVGRMGFVAMVYFEVMTTLALVVGLVVVNVLRPGDGLSLPTTAVEGVSTHPQTWDQILVHIVPSSVVQAMSEGDVLQIVVFSLFFALALGSMGEKGRPVVHFCEVSAEAMFRVTNMAMRYAPLGVCASIAYTVGKSGLGVMKNLAWLVGTLYVALGIFMVCCLLPAALLFKVPIRKFVRSMRNTALLAFSTTSSEAALPRAMEALEILGVPRRIVSFVLPLGYSFNLDGTTLYLSLAAVFVAQVAKVELTITQQITMMLTLMLTSKGVAAVPRASLIILAGTLASYGLPLEGLTLIVGVDVLMDMARTTVNVIGNCLATVIVAKYENQFTPASDEAIQDAVERGLI